jgi:hypothetical protein
MDYTGEGNNLLTGQGNGGRGTAEAKFVDRVLMFFLSLLAAREMKHFVVGIFQYLNRPTALAF